MKQTNIMKVRKNLLIFVDKFEDNTGVRQLVDKLEKSFTDYQAIVLTEDEYGGKRKARTRFKLTRFVKQRAPMFSLKLDVVNRKLKKPLKAKKIIGNKLPNEYRCVYNAIVRFLPELVIATSPKTLTYCLEARRKGSLNCKVISFCKNFTLDKNFFDFRADGYIVENEDIKAELIDLGVRPENISVLGLPFEEKKFIIKEIVAAKEKLGLNFNTTVLLSGGVLGCGHLLDVFKLLLDQGDYLNVLVYCGSNAELYDRVTRINNAQKVNNVKVFVEGANISDLLTACDIVISAYDGGLIYRSLLRALPVVLYSPLSKAEERDFLYLEGKNLALYAKDFNDVIIDVYKILQQNMGASLKAAAKKTINGGALEDICKFLTMPDEADSSVLHN